MGGGGGGRSLTPEEIPKLEQVARESLRKGAEPEKHNVFLSFTSEDLADVNLLRGQAKNENSRKPFDSEDAEYVRRGIRERIRQSSVTIVYVSNHTAQSRWVEWEIRESIALGKGVIAMYKGDTPPSTLPPAIVDHRVRLVPWNQRELANAIERAAD